MPRASKPKPIEVFKPGRHVAASGEALHFSDADVAAIARSYDPKLHDAPLVIGHPKHDDPAYGWARSVRVNARGRLEVLPRDVNPQFAELVRQRAYKKISVSLYKPRDPSNPKPGSFYIRHIGFLGAQAPAVKGLAPVELAAAEDGVTFEFAEGALGERVRGALERLRELIGMRGSPGEEEAAEALENELEEIATAADDGAGVDADVADEVAADVADEVAAELPEDLEPALAAAIEAVIERRVAEALAGRAAAADLSEPKARRTKTDPALAAKSAELDEREKALAEREKAQRLQEHTDFLERTLESGRPLPCSRTEALALMEALDAIPVGTVSFGEADERSPLDVFKASFVTPLKKQVIYEEISGGASFAEGDGPRVVAERAQQYQLEQERLGNRISTAEAVRHVSRKGAE